jgi:DNA-binding IclR family transcriptional regulator
MPVTASASAERVVAVLTYLAGVEGERSLTDIATATGTNKTTCQSVLLALAGSGYVLRDDAHKTYRLGPAVLALASSTGVHHEALARARVAMAAMSAEFDVETTATVATHHDIVKVAQVPRPRLRGVALRPGQAVPFAWPLGAAHIAWRTSDVIAAWLERGGVAAGSAAGARAAGDLAAVRARGFSATARRTHPAGRAGRPGRPDRAITGDDPADWPTDQVADLDAAPGRVLQLSAPVFDADGHVLLVIGVLEHDGPDAATIGRHVERILDAAQLTTAAIGGAPPRTAPAGGES